MAERFDVNHEKELLVKAQGGDVMARQELHMAYRGLLDNIVYSTFRSNNYSVQAVRYEADKLLDDLIDKWNPTAGNKPSTYFMANIKNKLKRYVNDNANIVRSTENFAWRTPKFKEGMQELTTSLNRQPTDQEIFDHMRSRYPDMKLTLHDIPRFKSEMRTTMLASTVVGKQDEGSALTLGDLAFSTDEGDVMSDYIQDLQAKQVIETISGMYEPLRTVMRHYLGIPGYQKMSLRELTMKTGLNKYRVQQYIAEGGEKLQDVLY